MALILVYGISGVSGEERGNGNSSQPSELDCKHKQELSYSETNVWPQSISNYLHWVLF